MGLRWESAPFGLGLGYRPDRPGGNNDGTHVALVRRQVGEGWIGFYHRDGLLLPPDEVKGLGSVRRPGTRLAGRWETADEAMRAVDRHHDAVTSGEPPPG